MVEAETNVSGSNTLAAIYAERVASNRANAVRQVARSSFGREFSNALAAVRDHWRHGASCEAVVRDLADVIARADA